jgi:PAS domain S-box-containing protein
MALIAPDGRWLDLNPAYCALLGYTKEELLRSDFMAITLPGDLEKDPGHAGEMLRGKRESFQMEKRYIHKNGETIHVILTASLVWNAAGTPDFIIAQVVDITGSKTLVHELEEENESLQKTAAALATKNSQLQEIQHMIGHDVRGPVRSIGAMIKMVEDGLFDFSTMAPMIQQNYTDVEEVITGLLDIAEMNAGEKIPFEDCLLKNMSEEIVESLKIGITEVIDVRYHFEVAVVFYPRRYLRSALYNLISNAIKYRSKDRVCVIEISSMVRGNEVAIIIKDNGIGFDMNRYKNAVFKPGKVFHSGYDSKGIGLFITKNQVEKFGGTITVKSEVGNGTEFTITV